MTPLGSAGELRPALRLIRNFIALAALLTPSATWAQVGTSSTSTRADAGLDLSLVDPALEDEVDDTIEEIVVTGSRTEKLLSDAPVATDVIGREAVRDSGAPNLEAILETLPGVQLERRANGTGLQLQGLNPEHVLLLIDGERVAGKTRDQFDVGQFDLENVERVEIVRGAASALYGADAMGGVVNIITREGKKPLTSSARATYGQLNQVDLIGNVGTRQGKLSLNVSGGLHRADAFDLDPSDEAPNGNPTSGDGFTSWNVAARADYEADEDTNAGLRVRYRTSDVNGLNAIVGTRGIIDRNERIERLTVSGGPVLKLPNAAKLRVSVVHSRYRQQIVQDQIGTRDGDSSEDNRQVSNQATVQYDRLFGDQHFVSIGVEGLHEQQDVEFTQGLQDRRRGAIYVQDEWTILEDAERLVVIPSLRYDADSQFGGRPSPRLAARFDPFRELTLRASYGWGFRPPTFENLYLVFVNPGSNYRINGNPDLVPEVSQGVNIDATYRYDDLVFTAAGFFNAVDNLITTLRFDSNEPAPCGPTLNPNRLSQFCYSNVADAQTMGVSLGVGYRYERYLEANTSLDLLRTKGSFPTDEVVEHELPGRPNVRATLRVTGRVPDWGTKLVVRAAYEGPAELFADFDLDGNDDTRPAFALLDLRVAQDLFEYAEAFVGVENLLDAGDHYTLPLQPRTFYAGVAGRFDIEPTKDATP